MCRLSKDLFEGDALTTDKLICCCWWTSSKDSETMYYVICENGPKYTQHAYSVSNYLHKTKTAYKYS